MNKIKQKQKSVEWRKRTVGSKKQVGQSFILEPHGHRSDLPRGCTVVETIPSTKRKLAIGKANMKDIPVTKYTDRHDKERVKYFKDLIARGVALPPAEIHYRPDGTIEVLDGKHRIEAYREFGYKRIPVVENATLYDELHGMDTSEGNIDEMPIIGNAIEPLVGEPNFIHTRRVILSPEAAADLGIHDETTLGYSQQYRAKSTEVGARQGISRLSQGREAGRTPEFRTRTVGTSSQIGTHFPLEPHGDKTALPKELQIAEAPSVHVLADKGVKRSGLDVQYIDEDIRDKQGYKYMAMNYQQAAELGIYFPYSEDTILISKSLNSEEREQALEMQVREIAKMKNGASYLEAHAQVMKEMPEAIPKRAGFWDALKGLTVSAMQNEQKRQEVMAAKRKREAIVEKKDTELANFARDGLITGANAGEKYTWMKKAKDTRTPQKQKKDMLVQ